MSSKPWKYEGNRCIWKVGDNTDCCENILCWVCLQGRCKDDRCPTHVIENKEEAKLLAKLLFGSRIGYQFTEEESRAVQILQSKFYTDLYPPMDRGSEDETIIEHLRNIWRKSFKG